MRFILIFIATLLLSFQISASEITCSINGIKKSGEIQNKTDGAIEQSPPLEFPIHRIFENVQKEQPWKKRTLSKAQCTAWWQDRVVVGELDVSDSKTIRYGYICERRFLRYDCGASVDKQFYRNIDRFYGYISANVEISAGKLVLSNVSNYSDLSRPRGRAPSNCANYLVNFVKSKDGSSLR